MVRERIEIYVANLGRYNEGCLIYELVQLPIDKKKLDEVLTRIGINEQYEEFFICDYQCLLSNLHISEYASIAELNELAEKINGLADHDFNKLAAVLESEGNISMYDIKDATEQVKYSLYFDFNAYGIDIDDSGRAFSCQTKLDYVTKYGYICGLYPDGHHPKFDD